MLYKNTQVVILKNPNNIFGFLVYTFIKSKFFNFWRVFLKRDYLVYYSALRAAVASFILSKINNISAYSFSKAIF